MFNEELTNILEEFSGAESDIKNQMEVDNEDNKNLSQIQKEKVIYRYMVFMTYIVLEASGSAQARYHNMLDGAYKTYKESMQYYKIC